MDENTVVELNVTEEKTENGEKKFVAEKKPTFGDKFRKTWVWKNRGKIGAGLGAAAGFVGAMILGNKGSNDEGPTE